MASLRTRKRKQQRLAAKARRSRRAADLAWWASLSNQEKHDADYDRYRIDVLGHSPLVVAQARLNAMFGGIVEQLTAPSALYERLRK